MLDLIVLHGEFSIFTVRGNFWYQIYRNRRKKILCSRLSLITLTSKRLVRLRCTDVLVVEYVVDGEVIYIVLEILTSYLGNSRTLQLS